MADSGLHAQPFGSLVELRAAQAQLGELRRTGGDTATLWAAVDEFIWRGAATGVTLDNADDRWSVQGVLDYWAAALERAGRPVRDSTLEAFDSDQAPSLPDAVRPYPGLDAFEPGDAEIFFGRDALLDRLVEQLAQRRLVAVVGPAGAGKSSLVLAGLVPRLRKGAVPGSSTWRIPQPLVPGPAPRADLAALLSPPDAVKPSDTAAGDGEVGDRATPEPAALVVVDRFEELFTACPSEAERTAFLDELVALATTASPPHRVVLAVRSEFESFLARHPALHERITTARIAVTAPSSVELRQAIEAPALQVGLRFDAGVVDRMLPDLLGEPAGLPLLQFTLQQLWHARDRNRITEDAYERAGGGRHALVRTADTLYAAMSAGDQAVARRILVMVGLAVDGQDELPRTRVPRTQIVDGDDRSTSERVLDRLLEAHVLHQKIARADAAPDVEVAHEALVRSWPLLAGWLQEVQAPLAERRRLEARARDWVRLGRGRAGLLDEVLRRDAERWLATAATTGVRAGDDILALVAASRRRSTALTRRRYGLIAAALVAAAIPTALLITGALRPAAPRAPVATESEPSRDVALPAAATPAAAPPSAAADLEQGRALLLDGPGHPMRALPYLVAARAAGNDSPVLRMLFAQAARATPLVTLAGHTGPVVGAAWSRDGTRVVTASDDMTARVWDAATGKPITPPLAHGKRVTAAAFSRDGTRVVTASHDRTARVWDARTGKPVTPPLEHYGRVVIAGFSPDGARLITATDDGAAQIWDAATGKPSAPPLEHRGAITAAAFSPDGARAITGGDDGTARVWDAATGKPAFPPLEHRGRITAAGFSPDGARVVTASDDHTAQVWDAETGKPIGDPIEHSDAILAAELGKDGVRLVTGSADRTARIWEAASGRLAAPPLAHAGAVTAVAFSPDGARVVTASADRTARVWDAATGRPLAPPFEHPGVIAAAAFSPDGNRVVTASSDGTARIWDARPIAPAVRVEHRGPVLAVAISPEGARIATASKDGVARIWNAQTGAPVAGPFAHDGPVAAVVFSPDGTRLVTASWDQTARVWNARTGAAITPPLVHAGPVTSAAFSADGTRVATASDDRTARVWDAKTGKPVTTGLGHGDAVKSVAFSPDGGRVVTASWDSTARVWDAVTGKPLTEPLAHTGPVAAAVFHPAGLRVVTASWDRTARVWDAVTGEPITPPLVHQRSVASAAFSPDGTRVVTASDDTTARVWDAVTGKPLTAPLEYQGFLSTAAFSPDGARVVAASWDGTIAVWDAATGKPLTVPLDHRAPVHAAVWTRDGRIVTGSEDGAARVWQLPLDRGSLDEWRATARCSPFALVDGVFGANPSPRTLCARR